MSKKLSIGIAGVSGSGKTYTSLYIANVIKKYYETKNVKMNILLIDTEDTGHFYKDQFVFEIYNIDAPYKYEKLSQIITDQCENTICIIDSLSQFWQGMGGILDQQSTYLQTTGNNILAWDMVMPSIHGIQELIKNPPVNLICTFRSKQEYINAIINNDTVITHRVSKGPIFKDNIEYEFPIFIELSSNHMISNLKDITNSLSIFETIQEDNIRKIIQKFESIPHNRFPISPIINRIIIEAAQYTGDITKLQEVYIKYKDSIDQLSYEDKNYVIEQFKSLKNQSK